MERKIIAGLAVAAALLCAAWLYGATSADDSLTTLEQRIADLERRVAALENPEARFLLLGRPEDADRVP